MIQQFLFWITKKREKSGLYFKKPQLSSGYWSIADPKTKLLFGSKKLLGPHPFLILEDLALRYSLKECKEMLYMIFNNYYKKYNKK